MKLYDVFNSRLAVGSGLTLSSMVPPWMGYPVARWIADLVTLRKKSLMVRSVRANQWVITGRQATASELNRMVRAVFRSTGRSLYDFYHFFRRPKTVMDMVSFDPSFEKVFHHARREETGTILVVPHISNFDLIGRAVVLKGLPLHILSYPQPPGGYRWQNELRELPNMHITPMSIEALQKASQTLRANRVVVTGIDRPLPNPDAKYRPIFCGEPVSTPVFHIRLALKHNLPITVVSGKRQSDGTYCIWASDPIPMQRHPDLMEETIRNAETILSVLGEFIRKAPDQWAMFYPLWPEALSTMPA